MTDGYDGIGFEAWPIEIRIAQSNFQRKIPFTQRRFVHKNATGHLQHYQGS